MKKLDGLFSALMVPFDVNGKFVEKGLRELVRHNIDVMKIDGLYIGGSTGENFMLPTDLKREIFSIVKDEAKDKITLIAQVGSLNIDEAVSLGKHASALKYDAISSVAPFYYKFDFEEIRDYYFTITDAAACPMIIYSIPILSGVNMSLPQFGEIFKHKGIVGVKYTNADLFLLERLRQEYPEKVIYAGFDELLMSTAVLGVNGAIGSTYNITAHLARGILDALAEYRLKDAHKIQNKLNDVITALLENGLYQTLKIILSTHGIIGDCHYCRQPMKKLSPERVAKAKEIAKKFSL